MKLVPETPHPDRILDEKMIKEAKSYLQYAFGMFMKARGHTIEATNQISMKLPSGEEAPDEMTMGEYRRLWG